MPTPFDSSPGAGRRTTGATPSCCWTCCVARSFPSCTGPLRPARTPWRCCAIATGWCACAPWLRTGCRPWPSITSCGWASGCSPCEGSSGSRLCPLSGAYATQRQQAQVLLTTLEAQIAAVNQELATRAAADARVVRLRTHPGVGLQTALAVVHTLEPVTRFDRARRIAAYCGLDPSEHSSGDTTRYGHISKQGNRLLRFLLVEAAWSAVQHEEDLGRFFRRLRARKKPHAVTVVAVARKLVLRLYRMLREGIDYEEFRRRGRDARRARQCASPAQRG